jgi:hypothetical protein
MVNPFMSLPDEVTSERDAARAAIQKDFEQPTPKADSFLS